MNLILLMYKEYGEEEYPSIIDSFSSERYPGQDNIVRYLEKGKVKLASSGICVDCITGEIISVPHFIMTDGEYSWDSSLSYYVKKYNMRLPKDFENKVLGKDG